MFYFPRNVRDTCIPSDVGMYWWYAEHDRHIAGDTHIPSEVSMGIHISLGILVWGYTKHGDTHITVTPALAAIKFRFIECTN